MHEQGDKSGLRAQKDDRAMVWWVTVGSLLLLAVLAAGGWYFQGWGFARSLLIGGILVNTSFWLLQKDARRLLQRISATESGGGTGSNVEKTRFFLRSFARLVVLGLLLFVLAAQVPIDVIGLTLGFATVMASVVIIGLGAGRRWVPSKV
jgi:hypothetical protein